MNEDSCEKSKIPLNDDAYICVHACTFCDQCTHEMSNICPNCRGKLVRRRRNVVCCPILKGEG
ncbi:DUF1272 domain-containing protein [Bacillus pinisoli]|uniref:DUF1272 domain-containing protein n=1 Tax=Bacillus pinisoli TaxID=2901866 RepID=UPI001FF5498E